jgi:hypothetical protein
MMSETLLAPVQATFRAVAETVVPETASLGPEEWRDLITVVERALMARPEVTRGQVVTFLRLVEYLPLTRLRGRFSRMAPDRRREELERLERSRTLLFRRGVWGVRTLIFMGYYTRPQVQASLGYRATAAGWSARRPPAEPA